MALRAGEREDRSFGQAIPASDGDEDCSEYWRSSGPGSRWTFKPRLRGGALPYRGREQLLKASMLVECKTCGLDMLA